MAWTPYNVGAWLEAYQSCNRTKRRLLVIGDSQFSMHVGSADGATASRLPIGIRNKFDVPFFSMTGHAQPTGSGVLCGYNFSANTATTTYAARTQGTSSPWTDTSLYAPNSVPISLDRWSQRQFTGDAPADEGGLFGFWASSGSGSSVTGIDLFSRFRRGSWLTASFKCRPIIYCESTMTVSSIDSYAYRNGSPGSKNILTSANWTPADTTTGVHYQDVTCNGNTTNEPWLRIFAATGVTEAAYTGSAVANSEFSVLGCVFESTSATVGMGLTCIGNSGWPAGVVSGATVCSAANFNGYLKAVGQPDMLLYMYGHNLTNTQVTGSVLQAQWKTDVLADIAWLKARIAAAGYSGTLPILMLTPWRNSASGGRADRVYDDQNQALYEIARDDTSGAVGTISLAHACPDSATLNALGYTLGGGSPDFHPQTNAASDFFIERMLDSLNGGYSTIARARRRIR